MQTIAIFMPSEYFTPVMSPKLKEKLRLCNDVLQALSIEQPYVGNYPSRYRQLENEENELPVWEKSWISAHIGVPLDLLNDAIFILENDEYIKVKGDLLYLTKKGKIFLIKEDGYDYGQNEPLPELNVADFIFKDGMYIPKPKEEQEIRYQSKMSKKQRTTLTKFLKTNQLVNDPAKFVAFLNGENNGEGIEIVDNNDNLTAVTLLLKELRSRNLIQLNFGNEFREFFTSKVRPFSILQGKEQIEQFRKELRKHKNKEWLESPTAKNLDTLLKALITAGITVFVIPL